MIDEQQQLIRDHLALKTENAAQRRDLLESIDKYKKLAADYKKLEEKMKISQADKVKRMIEIFCLQKDAKSVTEYTKLVQWFDDALWEWKEREKWFRLNEKKSDREFCERKIRKLKKYITRLWFAF